MKKTAKRIAKVGTRLLYYILTLFVSSDPRVEVSASEDEKSSKHYNDLDEYETFLERRQLQGRSPVLDIGSGNGRWLKSFSNLGCNAVGIDPSGDQLREYAKYKTESDDTEAARAISEQLPMKDDTFDLVFSYGVIMFTNVEETITEVDRVLKQDGGFFLHSQGPGYPLMMMYESLQAREYYRFQSYALVFSRYLTEFLDSKSITASGWRVIPPAKLVEAVEAKGWTVKKVELHKGRGYQTFLSLPVAYSVEGSV